MLHVKNISYAPPQAKVLQKNLSFTLNPGEMLHVAGANGCGKSLLSKAIMGDLPILSGEIENTFNGTRYLSQMQNRATHLPFSLADILYRDGERLAWEKISLLEKRQLDLGWNEASGGERQRTLLTRFFLQVGDLLLIDEPFNHLDLSAKEKVRSLIQDVFSDPRIAVILISHEENPSSWMGSKIVVRHINLELTKVGHV